MGKKIRYIRKRRDSYILYECMRITVFLVSGDSSKKWESHLMYEHFKRKLRGMLSTSIMFRV